MNPLIFIIDDDSVFLINLRNILEVNNYDVITADNGKLALEILSKIERIPEIIISDIIMPEMDGYDFFKAVSDNPLLNHIPFIFLSGRSTPEDVRLGKMLGVDDYITKPFKIEDLLAIIAGKIARNKKLRELNEKIDVMFSSLKLDITSSISEEQKSQVILLLVYWDDRIGPRLISNYPERENFPFSIEKIGSQLFHAIVSMYGYDNVTKAGSILLNIENIKRKGYIFFDSFKDDNVRGGEQRYMLGLVAPKINYFDSLKIKELFKELSLKIKEQEEWGMKNYWEKLSKILSSEI